jgi:hypothetical protein
VVLRQQFPPILMDAGVSRSPSPKALTPDATAGTARTYLEVEVIAVYW